MNLGTAVIDNVLYVRALDVYIIVGGMLLIGTWAGIMHWRDVRREREVQKLINRSVLETKRMTKYY